MSGNIKHNENINIIPVAWISFTWFITVMKIKISLFIFTIFLSLSLIDPYLYGAQNANHGSVFVLCYHSFRGKDKIPTDVSINELKDQLDYLKKNGFRFISFSQIQRGLISGQRNILITIDDGNRSIIEANEKVFRPMGIKPLLGVYPNLIGRKDYALNWEELKKLSDEGFDIASHGYYHLPLSEKLFNTDKTLFTNEIFKSKKMLKEKLSRNIDVFIYPNGLRNDIAKKMLKEAGYKYAFIIVWGQVELPLSSNTDPFELHRYMVSRNFNEISSVIFNKVKSAEQK
jgi:peptidoglycan/xylan/chitin deacetylase (PgdA/CDA1 family)